MLIKHFIKLVENNCNRTLLPFPPFEMHKKCICPNFDALCSKIR